MLLAAGSGITASAAENSQKAVTSEVPRVTFTNKENTTPDLHVIKNVESVDLANPAPADAEFTFGIKVDGELYKNQEYELYRADASGKSPELRRTDRNGSFQLKAGDRARFVYLGAGKHYEVYEESQPENFVQIIPAQGTSITGTIPPAGAQAVFTNRYLPQTDPSGPGTGEKLTKFLVSKRVAFPQGYMLPESPDFRFRITLDGKAYSQQSYEIFNQNTGLSTGKGETDNLGEFTLKAGEQAEFADVPVNQDYKVEELLDQGWWSVNDIISQEGSTKAPAVAADFQNSNTSFIVTKQLEDNSKPDVSFTFNLMKGDRTHWADATYYLYSTKGNLIDETLHKTDKNGQFFLKPGQAAVFIGIEPGTLYHVEEIKHPEYSQLTPIDPAGYRDKVVQKNVEMLPFVNRKEAMNGVLTVTKQVEAKGDVVPENPQEFTFCIRKKTENTDTGATSYEILKDIPFQIHTGMETQTKKTDQEGRFTLKAGQTARFESLLQGSYQVEEILEGLSPEYSILEQQRVQEGELFLHQEGDGLAFIFVNQFEMKPLTIKLKKTGWSEDTVLNGAVFRLYRDKNFADEILPEGHPEGQAFQGYISGSDGMVTIPELQAGTYYLKETKAPDGYQLLANPLEIVITRNGNQMEAMVNSIKPTPGGGGQVTIENNTVTIRIKNNRNFTLPATGGAGITFLLVAVTGMAFVIGILWKKGKVKINK